MWDLKTQERVRTIKFETAIYIVELHPQNPFLFVCSLYEDHPYLVDVTHPTPVKHRLPTRPIDTDTDVKQSTTSTIFSVNGNHIISGTSKGYINIIETQSRRIIHSTKLSAGIITLLRLTSNGRQMLVNSTDRIIRVIDMPDLTTMKLTDSIAEQSQANGTDTLDPDNDDEHSGPDPSTLPENIHLPTTHKFQDLVNRLRWNDCAFSHTSTTAGGSNTHTVDYVTASTFMKRDIYIWELTSSSLLRILENAQEPTTIEWHPSKPLLVCIGMETGNISVWGIEPTQKWSALAPDFTEVTENVEYVEREDEFGMSYTTHSLPPAMLTLYASDTYPVEEERRRRLEGEDESVDVLSIVDDDLTAAANALGSMKADDSFVLPMLYDIVDSEAEDQLIQTSKHEYRKKDIHEGKEYEDDGGGTPVMIAATTNGAKSRRRK